MVEAARSEALRGALAVHQQETEEQIRRLDLVFQQLGIRPEGVQCRAIQGIIEEGEEVLQMFSGGDASDAGLIASAQAIDAASISACDQDRA